MAGGVNWSPEAIDDVESIASYIARDSVFYAKAVVKKIFSASQRLDMFPESGRIVPEIGDDKIREIFVYSYRVMYRIEENQVLVVAVIHGKRLLEPDPHRFTPD